ncbi:hypothetical protein [Tessaracoccus sp. ZS01]|uniref:hypothetical protein n=1 Tax=Tessaracoccus sp. ZS01 TaxID=1906324 RepID=UPI00096FBD0E|nr:hypothetical protein [Tessaracoccus sp. ZS01]MCG6566961.1 hypothetical protein [Tessaracoccus sp. ZS01]OMG58085.1 hypothetical protein BJN44_04875 [Tessaracoccus sp. ZS01]
MRRSLAAATLVLAILVTVLPAASASSRAEARVGATTTAAAWGVAAVGQGAAPTGSPLILIWTNLKGFRYSFVDLVNVGTVEVSGASLLLDSVALSGGNNPSPQLTFDACVGADWNPATATCSGEVVHLGMSAGGILDARVVMAAGARISLRVLHSANPNQFQSTLQVAVSRGQVRDATTTNS